MEAKTSLNKVHGLQTPWSTARLRWPKSAAVTLLLIATSTTPAAAEAWLAPAGEYYFKLSGSWVRTEEEFNYLGERQEIFAEDQARSDPLFRDISVNAYVEYGLTEHLTIVSSTQFKNVRTWEKITPIAGVRPKQAIRTNYGLSDLWTRIRVPLLRRPFAASFQTGLKVPLGYDDEPSNEGPPIGTGEVDGDFAIYAGYSFWPFNAYVDGGVGYRVRGGKLNDEIFYSAEIGYARQRLFAKVRFDGITNTVDPPDIAGFTVVTPAPGNVLNQVVVGDQDVFRVSAELNVGIYRNIAWSSEVFHVFAGKDTVTGTSLVAGIVISTL